MIDHDIDTLSNSCGCFTFTPGSKVMMDDKGVRENKTSILKGNVAECMAKLCPGNKKK